MVSFLLIFYFKISSNWTLREGLSFHQRVREKQFVAMVCSHMSLLPNWTLREGLSFHQRRVVFKIRGHGLYT